MKRRLEKYTKLRGYDIHRFRTQIELQVNPDFNSGESTTTFYFTDPLAVAAEIIGNPNIVSQKQHFHMKAAPLDAQGNRLYTSNLNSGDWWSDTETQEGIWMQQDDLTLLPMIFFIDKTHVVRSGRRKCYPIMLTVGNLDSTVRSSEAQRIVGYLPILHTEAKNKPMALVRAEQELRIRCFSALFHTICQAYQNGGIYFNILGKCVCCLPVIPFIIQDSQEGNSLSGCKGSNRSKYPCRHCYIPREHFNCTNDPFIPPLNVGQRIQHTIVRALTPHIIEKQQGVHGAIGRAEAVENELSVYAVYNPLWFLPYGASLGGVFSGCPPELLHQFLLGLMKYAFEFTWALVDTYQRVSKTFNERFQAFNGRLESDPTLFYKHYSAGTQTLNGIEAKEYLGLLLQSIVCIGLNNTILVNAREERAVLKALSLLVLMHHLFWEDTIRQERDFERISKMVPVLLASFRSAFDRFSKTKCNFYKFHATHHLVHEMRKWGSMRVLSSEAGESMNRVVKKRFKKTSKKKSRQNQEMYMQEVRSALVSHVTAGMDCSTLSSGGASFVPSAVRYKKRKMYNKDDNEQVHNVWGNFINIDMMIEQQASNSDCIGLCKNLLAQRLNADVVALIQSEISDRIRADGFEAKHLKGCNYGA